MEISKEAFQALSKILFPNLKEKSHLKSTIALNSSEPERPNDAQIK